MFLWKCKISLGILCDHTAHTIQWGYQCLKYIRKSKVKDGQSFSLWCHLNTGNNLRPANRLMLCGFLFKRNVADLLWRDVDIKKEQPYNNKYKNILINKKNQICTNWYPGLDFQCTVQGCNLNAGRTAVAFLYLQLFQKFSIDLKMCL